MHLLVGLHSSVAVVLLCALLFVDEAGLPLPLVPNEVLLILAGVLISDGAVPVWLMVPLAYAAMALGMLAGYAWARTLGQAGLQAIAERVGAQSAYNRARARLQTASSLGIAGARMVPGLRPYATLVSGAAEVQLRTFLVGALPALLLWEIVLIGAGVLVGLPIVHLLGHFEKVVVRGAVLIALGVISWLAVRDVSPDRRAGIVRIRPRWRAGLALVVDAAIVVSIVGGAFAMARRALGTTTDIWLECIVAAVLLIALLAYGRGGQTPGEVLFEANYWHRQADQV